MTPRDSTEGLEQRQRRQTSTYEKWKGLILFLIAIGSIFSTTLVLLGFDLQTPQSTKAVLFKVDSALYDSVRVLRISVLELKSSLNDLKEQNNLLVWIGCSSVGKKELYIKNKCESYTFPRR